MQNQIDYTSRDLADALDALDHCEAHGTVDSSMRAEFAAAIAAAMEGVETIDPAIGCVIVCRECEGRIVGVLGNAYVVVDSGYVYNTTREG